MSTAVIISIFALGISISSLTISVYQSGVDRRLQYQKKRSRIITRITSKNLEILPYVEDLISDGKETDNVNEQEKWLSTVERLSKVLNGLTKIREHVNHIDNPPIFTTSFFLKNITSIKTDLDDMEVILDDLLIALDQNDINKINSISSGLLERIYGS